MAYIAKLYTASIIAAIAIIATVSIIVFIDYDEKLIPEADALPPYDAMKDIKDQIVVNLGTAGATPEVQRENIKQADSLIFGKPVILATNGVTDTFTISTNYDIMVDDLRVALTSCADGSTCTDSTVQAESKELLDRTIYWQETKENLEVQTALSTCDVLNPATCPQLNLGDEPQAFGPGITVGTDKIWNGWYREIRSPYGVNPAYNPFSPSENIIPTGVMAPGECSTVIKEIQGVKAIQRPVKIPIWQEPWTSRASIIGFNTVWVVDFVPAEFVKSLNTCNVGGSIVSDYTINVIIERELTHFWKFLPAGIP